MVTVSMTVNGKSVSDDVEPRTLLVQFLREHLRLTGAHVGCDTSQCGACVVLVDGKSAKSCTMLAAQAEGVGAALTSLLLFENDELLRILGVPTDEGWNMASCVTFGYPTGRWGVAPRRPVHEVAHRNQWGRPVGFEVPEPLWSY